MILPGGPLHPGVSARSLVPILIAPAVLRAVLIGGVLFLLLGCAEKREPELDFLVATERVEYEGVEVSSERIEQLRADIKRYRARVEELTTAMSRVASFQKMLANELMQQGMYEPALEALQQALELQTGNPVLYYLAAVAAGHAAPAHILDGRSEEYLEKAEQLYRQAIRINPRYREALYGLSVLLAFELDRPGEALEYARRTAQIETRDPAIRFLLANILVRNEQYREAAEIYEELSRTAPSPEQRRKAAENRDAVRREIR
ncbi:MAG: hypothetical protein EA427_10390 [Spirochaetaceae bacterium]|nr:MAG: hypothetical protein EA427_10390 [Spirochaetaceae bacterium]